MFLMISGLSLFSCSTIEEDLADCDETVEISYQYLKGGQNRFGTDVSSMDLFIFDEQGYYVGRWNENDNSKFSPDYKMSLKLPPGTYSFIAWGGLKNNDYTIMDADQSTAMPTLPVVGQTKIEEMLLRVRESNLREVDYRPSDLFYGDVLTYTLPDMKPGVPSQLVIDLDKFTKQVDVKINGVTSDDVTAYLTSPNGRYTFLDDYEAPNVGIKYMPIVEDQINDLYSSTFHTLRMSFGREIKLTVWDNKTNSEIFVADILEDYIRKIPEYSTQAAIDAEDYFLIEIWLDPFLQFTVKVNGWVVSNSITDF